MIAKISADRYTRSAPYNFISVEYIDEVMTQDCMKHSTVILVDARGLNCPLPVLKLRKILKGLPPGAEVELLATERAALRDVPAFCRAHGHQFESFDEPEALRFAVRNIGVNYA